MVLFFYLICQDMDQLIGIYGGTSDNYGQHAYSDRFFAPMVQRSIQYISKMAGQTTAIKEQVTTSGKRMGPFNTQVSTTFQEVSRPLMTEDEVMRMPKAKVVDDKMLEGGTMLVFVAGTPAIYGKQMPYFLDPKTIGADASPLPRKRQSHPRKNGLTSTANRIPVEASLMLSRRIHPLLKRSFQFVSLGVMLIVTAQYILVINTTRSFPLEST